jgi:putative ABC transport system substrate-binding protein
MKTARRRLLALALLPFAAPAVAQPRKPWRIGYLAQASPAIGSDTLGEFRNGMKALGYQEGQHYVLEIRDAESRPERMQEFAAELVALRVDVIVAATTPPALSAMRATRSIPIVFAVAADPVGNGLVQSLARPGGNVTGNALAFDEVSRKWLELLMTVRSRLSRVAVLSNPSNDSMRIMLESLHASAPALNVKLTVYDFAPGSAFDSVLDSVRRDRPDGLVVLPDNYLRTHVRQITELATRLRVPAIYGNRPWAEAGGLMSYGPDQRENYRRAASYVEKILKGAKPADLPVERPTRFEFVVNLKSAREAGLTIPPSLLARADKVIE